MTLENQILARLTRMEEKLERLAASQEEMGALTRSYESWNDLGRDMSLLMSPSVKLLTEGLAEVETGFQLEDIFLLLKRLLLSFRNITWSLEQLENLVDLWQDLEPLLKIAVPHFIDRLEELEKIGIFRINRAVLNMYAKLAERYMPEDIEVIGDGFVRMHGLVMKFSEPVVINFFENIIKMYAKLAEHYSPEDINVIGNGFVHMHGLVKKFSEPQVIRLLEKLLENFAKIPTAYTPEDIDIIGDGFVRMHGIVKKFSDPGFLQFIEKLMEIPGQVKLEEARPAGPIGLIFRMQNEECRQGLGVVLELTRALGKLKEEAAPASQPAS